MDKLRLFRDICTECILIILYPVAGILHMILLPLFPPAGHGKTIVIVKRWTNQNFMHLFWQRYLKKKGFRVYFVNFSLLDGLFPDSADELNAFLEEKELTQVTLVGISGGGIAALLYLKKYGTIRVKRFVSIGTPFRGTPLIYPLAFIVSARELVPHSQMLKELGSIPDSIKKISVCIQARFDEMVPLWSSSLEGAHKITIDVWGHNNLHMAKRATYDAIAKLTAAT